MTQVKIIHAYSNLEEEINRWLLCNNKIEIIDIKYDVNNPYRALIIYKC